MNKQKFLEMLKKKIETNKGKPYAMGILMGIMARIEAGEFDKEAGE